MDKVLYLIMGIPGSGKSTLAKSLAPKENIFETDNFFIKDGVYNFDRQLLGKAHLWCQAQVREAVLDGITPIVVSNTNLTPKERKIYCLYAAASGYDLIVKTPESPWWKEMEDRVRNKTFTNKDIKLLMEKNVHGVPYDSIQAMMERWTDFDSNVEWWDKNAPRNPGWNL